MIQAIQVLRFHLLEIEKVYTSTIDIIVYTFHSYQVIHSVRFGRRVWGRDNPPTSFTDPPTWIKKNSLGGR